MSERSVGELVVDQLINESVQTVFCVPGESYLEVLNARHDSPIKLVVCRQDGGAGYMADAHARITGKTGVFMVTRGPGAANAMVALHAAWQDRVSLVLFVGLIPRAETYSEFQEFDVNGWFGTTTKGVFQVEHAERIPEIVSRAFALARTGRPGPVVIGVPENMLRDRVKAHAERRFFLCVICWAASRRGQNRYIHSGILLSPFRRGVGVGAGNRPFETSRWSKSNTSSTVWAEVWAGRFFQKPETTKP